jgi:hypothetical protein
MDGIGVFVPPYIFGKYACRGCEDTFIEEIVEVSQAVHVFGGDFYYHTTEKIFCMSRKYPQTSERRKK